MLIDIAAGEIEMTLDLRGYKGAAYVECNEF